ncbi:uncharacterized protein LAESUDRAFT_325657 [Laetiporus sulphureus 93-53]|uniref:DUF6533 domain-containing protein n=1 Tax=Laetiporus sulphureus 93-53 TaxID=1314785 RepID=A0A165CZA1_9APHY|nr:uncharacterized protein LAESUDRAFT_325657 [Laetiporus sulphureus 93-53]KZT03798.1 hypothetical protein LAESUDRAFT_325657 [Laetiporus sulphureus 93-53]
MSAAASEASNLLDSSFTEDYAVVAGAALILFDHAITFGQEVELFWGERSFSAWLFFANRMLALSYAIISVWSLINFDTVTLYGKLCDEQSASHTDWNNLTSGYNIASKCRIASKRRNGWQPMARYAPHTACGLQCGRKHLHRLHPIVIFCGLG